MNADQFTQKERRAVLNLSTIMALRMLGLFMVVPTFSLYAQALNGATPTLIGIAIGIYGLTQAVFQIPFGALSDKYGRKPLILVGLVLFALGSLIAGCATSITFMIFGRCLQGMGAIGSTTLALIADLTRENQRSKAMAISGITIGISFSLAMVLGPLLVQWFVFNQLFFIATFLAGLGIAILAFVPQANASILKPRLITNSTSNVTSSALIQLYIGIFLLHVIFTATFVAIPIDLGHSNYVSNAHQWMIYLPTLVCASIVSLVFIRHAEKNRQLKNYFLISILLLLTSEFLFLTHKGSLYFSLFALFCFFTGFSVLEAFMPSLVSKSAPPQQKGSALGIYSCAQFLGIFIGGIFGGFLYGVFNLSGVYSFCVIVSFLWFFLSCLMQVPHTSHMMSASHHGEIN